MNFIISNKEIFQTNSSIHNINTRNKHHLHRPNAKSCFQKEYILCWVQYFQQFTTQYDSLQEWQCKIQNSLKKILKYTLLVLCR